MGGGREREEKGEGGGFRPEKKSQKNTNKRAMMGLGRSPKHHRNQIISKSVHWFSIRSRLKLYSIYSPSGHLVQQSRTV